ncbi:MAG TPA: xanthine dehydrogenase family protein subunit M [Terriglobia bacterium]|nr:xanthine dehydrogenase family protein subunit M [Terriglobia bacterium]
MEAFEFAQPTSAREAVKLLAAKPESSEVLAGGSDVLARMKDSISTPTRLVSLHNARDLRGIEYRSGQGLRIGAMVTLEELGANAEVKRHYPGLVQAAENAGSPQIRNVGTVGGNLCQRPRCWYYRAGFGLLAMQDGKSLVPNGENRYHAIFGNSGPAYFVAPSNLAPMLIALGAKVRLVGPQGSRELPPEKFFVTPHAEGEREHDLKPTEIITEVMVPPAQGPNAYYEVRQKAQFDWPLATAGVVLRMSGRTISSARVVLGQVAPIPWASPEAEQALAGKTVSEEVADSAGLAAVQKATPLSHNEYKVTLARVAVKRAVLRAAQA